MDYYNLIEKENYLTLQSNIQAFYKKYFHYNENTFAIQILYSMYMLYHQKIKLYEKKAKTERESDRVSFYSSLKEWYETMFDFYFHEYVHIHIHHKKMLTEALEHIATILTDYS